MIPVLAVDITLCHFDSRTIHCRHVHANRQCLTNQSSRIRQCVWKPDQEPGSVFKSQIKSQALFHVEPPKSKAMCVKRDLSGEASFHKPVLRAKQCVWKPDRGQSNVFNLVLQAQGNVYERPSGEPGNVFNLVLQGVGLVLQASLKDKAVLYNQALKISFAMRVCECMVWYNKIR